MHINRDLALTDLTIRSESGATEKVHTSQNHPFWNEGVKAWVNAGDLDLNKLHSLVEAGGVGSARVAPVVAGGLPVVVRVAAGVDAPRTAGELQAQAAGVAGPSQVRVVVASQSMADAVGVHGVVLQVARADAAAAAGAKSAHTKFENLKAVILTLTWVRGFKYRPAQ